MYGALTVPDPFISRTDLAATKPGSELIHELIQSFVNKRLVFEDLGHLPQMTDRKDVLIVPFFVLRVEEVGHSLTIQNNVVGAVRFALQYSKLNA
jgi:hypothetical protein